jgi:3'-phosphoadenosine 5'-phosphosulfate sulfotransferase (PAPS reductase)/FAD synthetase
MKHIVGFSGGIDSQAAATWVLNRFPKENVILLNSNAGGNEHPLTTEHIAWFSANVHPVITVSAIYADLWKTPGYAETRGLCSTDSLGWPEMIAVKGRPPSRCAQFCTEVLKLRPSKRWVKENVTDGYVRYTGLRRGESDRRAKTPYQEFDEYFGCQVFHVVMDWTKQMCFDYCKAHGQIVNPLYAMGFGRVGCAPCINSGRKDIRNWAMRFPAMIDKIREWEVLSGRTFFAPMVPSKHTNTVDEVVAWAMCERGGTQYSLEACYIPPACESKFGLCE